MHFLIRAEENLTRRETPQLAFQHNNRGEGTTGENGEHQHAAWEFQVQCGGRIPHEAEIYRPQDLLGPGYDRRNRASLLIWRCLRFSKFSFSRSVTWRCV